jgi:PAB-dependent poly(A)-specific ribonuclease subunit 3
VFHQVSDAGAPWVDLSHIVQCLNKVCFFCICRHESSPQYLQLDAGTAERISLVSPDEKNIMIVSYHDLKICLSNAFQELLGH